MQVRHAWVLGIREDALELDMKLAVRMPDIRGRAALETWSSGTVYEIGIHLGHEFSLV